MHCGAGHIKMTVPAAFLLNWSLENGSRPSTHVYRITAEPNGVTAQLRFQRLKAFSELVSLVISISMVSSPNPWHAKADPVRAAISNRSSNSYRRCMTYYSICTVTTHDKRCKIFHNMLGWTACRLDNVHRPLAY